MRLLIVDYGWRYVLNMAIFFGLTKGFTGTLMRGIALPYFQNYFHVPLGEYHTLFALALLLPWSIKPLFGVLSDVFPIFRYRKRFYVLVSAVTLVLGPSVLFEASKRTAIIALTCMSLAVVCADLLHEASYAEQRNVPGRLSGNQVVTYAWGLVAFGGGVGGVAAGVLGDAGDFDTAFALALLGPVLLLGSTLFNNLNERPIDQRQKPSVLSQCVLAVTIAVGGVLLAAIMHADMDGSGLAEAVLVVIAVLLVARTGLDKETFYINLYLFLTEALSANFVGATDYFYTAKCTHTPRFTFFFYVTVTCVLAACFQLVGIRVFHGVEHMSVKHVFAGTSLARVAFASLEVLQAARWNVGKIPDEWFYLFGEAVAGPVLSMLYFMPMVVLTADLVKKDSEGLTYAILAGMQNMGGLFAATLGGHITTVYGVEGCNFSRFASALALGHMALPMALVPLAYLMLPDRPIRH